MHFTYCPHCGNRLIDREIGDEGMIPFLKKESVPAMSVRSLAGKDCWVRYSHMRLRFLCRNMAWRNCSIVLK